MSEVPYSQRATHTAQRVRRFGTLYVTENRTRFYSSLGLTLSEFAEHIDGFSIGSNDLTQLTLGLDRDSSFVAHLYDERNPAVKRMIQMLIRAAKKQGIKVGICGQGPSDFPDFAQFLVQNGIDSISVTPDSIIKTVRAIHEIEQDIQMDADGKSAQALKIA